MDANIKNVRESTNEGRTCNKLSQVRNKWWNCVHICGFLVLFDQLNHYEHMKLCK